MATKKTRERLCANCDSPERHHNAEMFCPNPWLSGQLWPRHSKTRKWEARASKCGGGE